MESLFEALFAAAADAILVVDETGSIVLANPASGPLLGRDPNELVGLSVESLLPERYLDHARQRAGYVREPLPRPMGRGLVITDAAGTITWVNPAATAMTGYASDELVGKHTRILKSGEHGPELYADLWRTVMRGETWSGSMVNRRKDGSLYDEEQTIAPVMDETGVVTHFIAIKRDVSAERRTRDALARAHEELAAHVTQIESLNRQLRDQAIRDPLTGLHNRRYLEDALDHAGSRTARSGEALSVVALDLDHFKAVNDTHGHATGDRVLRRTGEVLRAHVRASDIVGRVGGEEFIVALPGAPLAMALVRAEQWRTAVAGGSVESDGGVEVRCTVSIGVAEHCRSHETIVEALRRADAALYEAKRNGRDRVVAAPSPTRPA